MRTTLSFAFLVSLGLLACGGGSRSRYFDGTQGMGRDSVRLELRPDGQYTKVTWEGYSSAGTYIETDKNIIFTHPQYGQSSGMWIEDGKLKIEGHVLVPVEATKPMPKR